MTERELELMKRRYESLALAKRAAPKKTKAPKKRLRDLLDNQPFLKLPRVTTKNPGTMTLQYEVLRFRADCKIHKINDAVKLTSSDEDNYSPFKLQPSFYESIELLGELKREDRQIFIEEFRNAIIRSLKLVKDEATRCRDKAIKESSLPPILFTSEVLEIDRSIVAFIMSQDEGFSSTERKFMRSRKLFESVSIGDIVDRLSELYSEEKVIQALAPDSILFAENYLLVNYRNMESDLWDDVLVRVNPNLIRNLSTQMDATQSLFNIEKISKPEHRLAEIKLETEEASDIHNLLSLYKSGNFKNLSFLLYGESGTGKTSLAHAIANELGMKVATISAEGLKEEALPAVVAFISAKYKDSKVLILFDECESLWYNEYSFSLSNGLVNSEKGSLKQVLEKLQGVIVYTSNFGPPQAFRRRVSYVLEMKRPSIDIRAGILKKEILNFSTAYNIPIKCEDHELTTLAEKYELSGGYFQQALMLSAAKGVGEVTFDSLDRGLGEISNSITATEAGAVSPKIEMSKLILSNSQRETVSRILAYSKRWQPGNIRDPLMPKGLTILFEGPSGTGKTAMAEAIASELKLKFRRVTPSTFLSKYVGDTEKQIRKILKDAQDEGYLIFVDEAEGLLASREGSSHNWERTQIDEWLNQIEQFEGTLIAATNHSELIDKAFSRRFLFKVSFEIPSSKDRFAYIRSHLESSLGHEGSQLLAERFDMSFGEIRNVLVQLKTYETIDISLATKLFDEQINGRAGLEIRKIGII